MEQLYEVEDENEVAERGENAATTTSSSTISQLNRIITTGATATALPSLTLTEQQEAELNALEQAQRSEQTTPPSEKKQEVAIPEEINLSSTTSQADFVESADTSESREKDDIRVVEENVQSAVEDVTDSTAKLVKFEEEIAHSAVHDVRIEQESGQEMIEEEVGEANNEIASPTEEEKQPATKQEVGVVNDSPPVVTKKKEHTTIDQPLFDEASASDDPLFGSSETPPTTASSSIALPQSPLDREPKMPDFSDNPLYHDSDDEEQSYASTGCKWVEEAGEFGHIHSRQHYTESSHKRPALSLQLATFDPLQSNEFKSGSSGAVPYDITPLLDHTLAHTRYSSSPEQPPVLSQLSTKQHIDQGDRQIRRV